MEAGRLFICVTAQSPFTHGKSQTTNSPVDTTCDVALPFDKIEELFELDTGEFHWWLGIILATEQPSGLGSVKGTAEIEYIARHSVKKTTDKVTFLADRIVQCAEGETR